MLAAASVVSVSLPAVPASAAIYLANVKGSILEGTDTTGLLGTVGADLVGVPYDFTVYYRSNTIQQEGSFEDDFAATGYAYKGYLGDYNVPFHRSSVRLATSGQLDDFEFRFADQNLRVNGITASNGGGPSLGSQGTYSGFRFSFVNFSIPSSSSAFAEGRVGSVTIGNLGSGAGAVPEPATWLMLLTGFGAIGGAMRRTRRRSNVSLAYP